MVFDLKVLQLEKNENKLKQYLFLFLGFILIFSYDSVLNIKIFTEKRNITINNILSQDYEEESLVNLVDPFRGSLLDNTFSYGNTLPILSRPRGMTHWSVATTSDFDNPWFFNQNSHSFCGIRCTHQPSPWISDYGQFLITPILDSKSTNPALFSSSKSEYKPHVFRTSILNYCDEGGCGEVDFSPTEHGGIMKLRFPTEQLINNTRGFSLKMHGSFITFNKNEISGYSNWTQPDGRLKSFKHYFVLKINYSDNIEREFLKEKAGYNKWKVISKNTSSTEMDEVIIRIGVSFISLKQAKLNLAREQPNVENNSDFLKSFEKVVEKGKQNWNKFLSRIEVSDSKLNQHEFMEKKRTFYTNLYRTLLFPRDLSEINEKNETVHWSPYDKKGRILPGPLCTDSGFWDAYRTVYPFLHLVYPEIAKTIMAGWVNALRENGGRVPQWGSPGPRHSMVGTMSDVSLSEAIVNDVLSKRDMKDAYDSLLLSAYNETNGIDSRGYALHSYIKMGYVPDSVALTLNFKMADYAISRAAKKMGDEKTSKDLEKRASSWRLLFDNDTLFFRPKNINGKFTPENFDKFLWDQDWYTEGGPWQYRVYVPFDPSGLRNAYEQEKDNKTPVTSKRLKNNITKETSLCDSLMEIMTEKTQAVRMTRNFFHEGTELSGNCFGQYGHNNQPAHHQLYMFAHAKGSCPSKGQQWIQHTVDTLYGKFGYAGDEDNGEMSSWYILSSLGLYSLAPGSGTYQIGAPPLFENMVIKKEEEKDGTNLVTSLKISRSKSLKKSPLEPTTKSYYIANSVSFKGVKYDLLSDAVNFQYSDLKNGGSIDFA